MSSETLTGLLKKGQNILAKAGIGEAGLDAWLLLEYTTGKSRAYYFAHGEENVSEETADQYLKLIGRRAEHIPLQHLTHQAFFMGYEFYTSENVLMSEKNLSGFFFFFTKIPALLNAEILLSCINLQAE